MLEKIWVEKYRPKKIKAVVGNEQLKKTFEKYLEKGEIPNVLLYGPPGTGKTTISKILIKTLDCEYLFLNGSDENGIDVIRNKIGTFVSSVTFDKKFKIVFIDESDYISLNAQSVLRNLIESSSDTARFIFTCNYPEKLMEPLRSRFQMFEVKPPELESLEDRAKLILDKEEVKYNDKDIKTIVKNCYPDIRKLIQTLQQNNLDGELSLKVGGIVSDTYKSELIDMLKKKDSFEHIRGLLVNVNAIEFTTLYKLLFESVDEYAKKNKVQILLDISEHMYRDSFVVDKEINLSACILKILKSLGDK